MHAFCLRGSLVSTRRVVQQIKHLLLVSLSEEDLRNAYLNKHQKYIAIPVALTREGRNPRFHKVDYFPILMDAAATSPQQLSKPSWKYSRPQALNAGKQPPEWPPNAPEARWLDLSKSPNMHESAINPP